MRERHASDDPEAAAAFPEQPDVQRQLADLQQMSDQLKARYLWLISLEMERRVVSAEHDWRRRAGARDV